MTVRWTRQAYRRLEEIRDYIARDDPRAVTRHIRKLIRRAQALVDHPSLGRPVPELPGADLRELVEDNYRIVYRVNSDEVQVLTVFETHHLLPAEDLGPSLRYRAASHHSA